MFLPVFYYWVMKMNCNEFKNFIYSKKKIIIIGVILFLLVIASISLYFINIEQNKDINQVQSIVKEDVNDKEIEIINNLTFDIKGAVKKPGVYMIDDGGRVIDAIKLAGGLLENADNSVINLSKKITDEMVIIIYTKDEIKEMLDGDTSIKVIEKECVCPELKNDACIEKDKITNNPVDENTDTKINYPISINNATIEELMTLPGIGESKAKAIIQYREENGEFKKIEDIQNISGIGEKLFEQIKEYITI